MIDLLLGKRTKWEEAKYWRKEENKDYSKLIYESKPHSFFCSEEQSKTTDNNIIGGSFLITQSTITISTNDKIGIEVNDLVKFRGRFWIVDNIQEYEITKQIRFGGYKNVSQITYLRLRGADDVL